MIQTSDAPCVSPNRVHQLEGWALDTSGMDGATLGVTAITDDVLRMIARVAAREVSGVHSIGSNPPADLPPRDASSKTKRARQVTVEHDERSVRVRIPLVAKFGEPLPLLASEIRNRVAEAMRSLGGIDTIVDVDIFDVVDTADAPATEPSSDAATRGQRTSALTNSEPSKLPEAIASGV